MNNEQNTSGELQFVDARQFVELSPEGATQTKIWKNSVWQLIDDLRKTYDGAYYKEPIVGPNFKRLLKCSLLGICPDCGIFYTSVLLYLQWEKVVERISVQGGKPGLQRFLDGGCLNMECDSKDILIFWAPDQNADSKSFLEEKGVEWEFDHHSDFRLINYPQLNMWKE